MCIAAAVQRKKREAGVESLRGSYSQEVTSEMGGDDVLELVM